MRTGIFITARLGSTRLERKHLLNVLDKPIITYLIKRIQFEFKAEITEDFVSLIIVTGNKKANKDLENLCDDYEVYNGNDGNIPKRHLEAASDLQFDHVISVDGDDILCSTRAMRVVYDELNSGKNYVKTERLPLGMNVMGYSTPFLRISVEKENHDVLETGWGRIFNEKELVIIQNDKDFEDDKLRFTLDYDEDFQFFKSIIEGLSDHIYEVCDDDIINYVKKNELDCINSSISEEYWVNFQKNIDKEETLPS